MAKVDIVTVEVIRNYLISAAREMARNLIRTSCTTTIYEINDFGLGIYDRECRMIAEAPGLAIFTSGNDYALRKAIEFLGLDNIHPGDIILLNYPYWSSAHTLDVLAFAPVFHDDRLMAFVAVKMHWLDLNQRDLGYCLDVTELAHEGLIMPCLKIYERGKLNRPVEDLIRFNSRMPDVVTGDMHAQISACRTGEHRVKDLVAKFGPDVFEASIEEMLSHGERLARMRLAELPRGSWTAEDFIDDDGIDKDRLVRMKVTVTVSEDEMIVDWTGSDLATVGPTNLPIGLTMGVSCLAFKAITTPDTPGNQGNFAPLRVIAPEGSIMNAVPPASTFLVWPAILAPEVITKALAKGMPEIIPACSGGDIYALLTVGVHPKTKHFFLEGSNEGVGGGGHAGGDGSDGIMHLSEPGCRNNPVEMQEMKAPFIVENYGLRQDSCGAGLHRGGLGVTRTYHYKAPATAIGVVKKTLTDPWGMDGGKPGQRGAFIFQPDTDMERATGTEAIPVVAGHRITNNSAGGGGWGDPFARNPDAVLTDVLDELVSIEAASREYGVVIDPEEMTVDLSATRKCRQKGPSVEVR